YFVLKTVLASSSCFTDFINVVFFGRFAFVLASSEARSTIENLIRIQMFHYVIARIVLLLLDILRFALINVDMDIGGVQIHMFVNRILFASMLVLSGSCSLLLSMSHFSATIFPLRHNDIWTPLRVHVVVASVYVLATLTSLIFLIVQSNSQSIMTHINYIVPVLFCASSAIVYSIIMIKVRKQVDNSWKRAVARCLSRLSIIGFISALVDIIFPASIIVEKLIMKQYKESDSYEALRTFYIVYQVWNTFALLVNNCLGTWLFILCVPKFRALFFGKFIRPVERSTRVNTSTHFQLSQFPSPITHRL
ncbi:hypothetical protein PMAYCL1PPCAC_10446, partial [Pristionchus mayeri]